MVRVWEHEDAADAAGRIMVILEELKGVAV